MNTDVIIIRGGGAQHIISTVHGYCFLLQISGPQLEIFVLAPVLITQPDGTHAAPKCTDFVASNTEL